jgi:hypothetical protein
MALSGAGVRTYDATQVILSVNGKVIGGYADGTFIELERTSASFTKVVGADGHTSRAKTNDLSGTLTITLAQTSPSNDVLSELHNQDLIDNTAVFPIIMEDISGNTQLFNATGWVEGMPKTGFAKDISNREWVIHLSTMQFVAGGNVGAGL